MSDIALFGSQLMKKSCWVFFVVLKCILFERELSFRPVSEVIEIDWTEVGDDIDMDVVSGFLVLVF